MRKKKNENNDKNDKKKNNNNPLGMVLFGLTSMAIGAGISYLYNSFNKKETPQENQEKEKSNISKKNEKENKKEVDVPILINETTFEEDDPEIQSFICPITQNIMSNPVITKYGISYEKEAIEKWLEKHNTDPLSGQPLNKNEIFPNYALKNAIIDYIKKKEETKKEKKE